MARPETHLDLSEADRRGDEVVRWSNYSVMGFPGVAEHVVAATKAAQRAGLIVGKDGIFEPLSAEKLESNLLRAQERWDALKEKYAVAIDFPGESGDVWEINNWARENGLPLVKKP